MKKIGLLFGILLIGMVSYGQETVWGIMSEGICDSSIVEDKYADDITKQYNPVYLGKVNPTYHYTFNWDGELYVLAYRTNDDYGVKHVNDWYERRDLLLYRFVDVGNWVLASNDIIQTDYHRFVSYVNEGKRDYYEEYYKVVKAKFPDVNNPWGGVYFEHGKIVLQLTNKYWKDGDYKYFSNRIELLPLGSKMFRKIKSEEILIQ